MAASTTTSFALASILSILLFSGMQMYKHWLSSSQLHTILGGYLGSVFFVVLLTAVGNLETIIFGRNFQTKLAEVALCLAGAVTAAGMVHRVCSTTCLLFSLVALYYMNHISQTTYTVPAPIQQALGKKKNK